MTSCPWWGSICYMLFPDSMCITTLWCHQTWPWQNHHLVRWFSHYSKPPFSSGVSQLCLISFDDTRGYQRYQWLWVEDFAARVRLLGWLGFASASQQKVIKIGDNRLAKESPVPVFINHWWNRKINGKKQESPNIFVSESWIDFWSMTISMVESRSAIPSDHIINRLINQQWLVVIFRNIMPFLGL